MGERDDGDKPNVYSRADFRVNIGLIITMVVGFGAFIFSEITRVEGATSTKCERFSERLDAKADKTDARDRYTGTEAAAYARNVTERFTYVETQIDQRFKAAEKVNQAQHDGIVREIDHFTRDLANHQHSHNDILHEGAH